MEWIELIPNNTLPLGEILAANFKTKTYGYKEKLIGYLHMVGDMVVCENDNSVLENVTHYIPMNEFDPK